MRSRLTTLAGAMLLSGLFFGCSGGSMSEADSDAVTGEAVATAAESAETTTTTEAESVEADDATYRDDLAAEILATWERPGRDSRMPPRVAVVRVHLGPRGRLVRWNWQRRSPHGLFNDSIAAHLDRLVDSGRTFPLPPQGSPLRHRVLDEGVPVQFADDDA